jgi:hypothetical protein
MAKIMRVRTELRGTGKQLPDWADYDAQIAIRDRVDDLRAKSRTALKKRQEESRRVLLRDVLGEERNARGLVNGRCSSAKADYDDVANDILSMMQRNKYSRDEVNNLEELYTTTVKPKPGVGGSYISDDHRIEMIQELRQTFAHEFGHHVSYQSNGFMMNQTNWYISRTSGERLAHIEGYRREVIGKVDNFKTYSEYAGRQYPWRGPSSTPEVSSVGVEYIWKDPYEAAVKDPDWFNMIIRNLKKIS